MPIEVVQRLLSVATVSASSPLVALLEMVKRLLSSTSVKASSPLVAPVPSPYTHAMTSATVHTVVAPPPWAAVVLQSSMMPPTAMVDAALQFAPLAAPVMTAFEVL